MMTTYLVVLNLKGVCFHGEIRDAITMACVMMVKIGYTQYERGRERERERFQVSRQSVSQSVTQEGSWYMKLRVNRYKQRIPHYT